MDIQDRIDRLMNAPFDWGDSPRLRTSGWHSRFGGLEWRYDASGVYTRDGSGVTGPHRTSGAPITVLTALELYGDAFLAFAMRYGIPIELLLMTVGAEAAFARNDRFTGPRTFRWEAHVEVNDVSPTDFGDYSAGPMQTLATTARWVIRKHDIINYEPFGAAPHFRSKPQPKPVKSPLYNPIINIDIAAAEIYERWSKSKDDPILVAACFNAGGIYKTARNVWHIRSYGNHLDRAAGYFGDACHVMSMLRGEGARDEAFFFDLANEESLPRVIASNAKWSSIVAVMQRTPLEFSPEEYNTHENEETRDGFDIEAEIEAALQFKERSPSEFAALFSESDVDEGTEQLGDNEFLQTFGIADGTYIEDFTKLIKEHLEIEFFEPHEFLYLGGRNEAGRDCEGTNHYPPRKRWPHIINTAKMIDEIRRRLKAPIIITSGYRSEQYNRCVDGKPSSLHKKFNALDWVCLEGNAYEWWRVANDVRKSRSAFIGGIGSYRSFVHIDTRGKYANW